MNMTILFSTQSLQTVFHSPWWLHVTVVFFIFLLVAVVGYLWHLRKFQIQSKLLSIEVAERLKELSSLYKITAVVSNTLDFEETLAVALRTTIDLLNCDAGCILLLQKSPPHVTLAKGFGLSDETQTQLKTLSLQDTFLDSAVTIDQPIIFNDLTLLTELSFYRDGFQWLAIIPLTTRGHILGLLFLLRKDHRYTAVPNTELLVSIGNQIGVAIENARLYENAHQLAAAEERTRIARDLHDSVTQSLYSLTLLAEAGQRMIKAKNMAAIEQNQNRLTSIAHRALQEMRLLVFELRPLELRYKSLVKAIEHRLDVVERRAGVEARLVVSQDLTLSEAKEDALYRITHEALNNALKHAQATAVSVKISTTPESVLLAVEDNGCGFNPEQHDANGWGLISMRERIEQLDGQFRIISTENKGTTVFAEIPQQLNGETAVLERRPT